MVQIVLNSCSRQSCSVSTNVTSALEVSLNDMHYINSRFTYLLTIKSYTHLQAFIVFISDIAFSDILV